MTNVNQKSLETVFSIAICRQSGNKWQTKTLFIKIFYLHSSKVLMFSIAAYPVRSECQTVWIQVRLDVLSGYQQMALQDNELTPFDTGELLRTFWPSSLNLNLETCKEPRTHLNGQNEIRSIHSKCHLILYPYHASGYKNISILHLSCRTSDLQFSLILQTHALVL